MSDFEDQPDGIQWDIRPTESDRDEDYEDPEMGDMKNVPPESFEADPEDTAGAEDHA